MVFWKLGAVYFCTVNLFSSFQKLGAGGGGQPNNLFFGPYFPRIYVRFYGSPQVLME